MITILKLIAEVNLSLFFALFNMFDSCEYEPKLQKSLHVF